MGWSRTSAGLTGAVATVALPLGGLPAAAQASCKLVPAVKKFELFGDAENYVLAPGGDFEGGWMSLLNPWRLSNGAATVSGNETWLITRATDKKSLGLPARSPSTPTARREAVTP
jgi:hypothetical protein